eukprot:86365-Amphidinium_carterae.1
MHDRRSKVYDTQVNPHSQLGSPELVSESTHQTTHSVTGFNSFKSMKHSQEEPFNDDIKIATVINQAKGPLRNHLLSTRSLTTSSQRLKCHINIKEDRLRRNYNQHHQGPAPMEIDQMNFGKGKGKSEGKGKNKGKFKGPPIKGKGKNNKGESFNYKGGKGKKKPNSIQLIATKGTTVSSRKRSVATTKNNGFNNGKRKVLASQSFAGLVARRVLAAISAGGMDL